MSAAECKYERQDRDLSLCQYQGTDLQWYSFMNEEHYKNTVESGDWRIRFLCVESIVWKDTQ